MSTQLAVFTADNHLRPCTWSKRPDLQGDSFASFAAIVDYCVARNLPLFLLGDTFDATAPPVEAVVFFCSQMDRMAAHGIPVYFIKGNHDATRVASWPGVHHHCSHMDQCLVRLGDFALYGLDFRPASALKATLADIPIKGIDILLTHQSWQEIQTVGHTDGSFADIPRDERDRAPLLITGDYHIHGCYQQDGITAYSPGSTSMQKLNEVPDKYFYVLSLNGYDPEMHSHPIPTRPYHGFVCETEQEFEGCLEWVRQQPAEVANDLPAEIRKPILRVRFNDEIPEAYSRLVAAAGDKFHLFDEPKHVTEGVVIDVEATPEGAFESLITAIGQLSDPQSDQYNGARRLLESNDPKTELATMYQEYLNSCEAPSGSTTRQTDPTGVPVDALGRS